MKLQNFTFLLLLALGLMHGCAHKNIYQPPKVTGEKSYDKSLHTHVRNVVREGAILSDGTIISKKSGALPLRVPKGYTFINESDNDLIVGNSNGAIEIISKKDKQPHFHKVFKAAVVSANLKNNILAMVLADNTIVLYDIKADKELYKEALERVITIDARAANPVFLNDLIVFPTLDGRLLIMDSKKKIVLRDVAISDKELFNNVIFLKVHNNKLVAATASKVIVITPKNIYTFKESIKDILYIGHDIYLFAKNGTVIHLDEKLHKISEKPFEFANFVAVAEMGDKLYMVEKNGYLIKMDRNLNHIEVKSLEDEINKSVVIAKGVLYTDDKAINLK